MEFGVNKISTGWMSEGVGWIISDGDNSVEFTQYTYFLLY